MAPAAVLALIVGAAASGCGSEGAASNNSPTLRVAQWSADGVAQQFAGRSPRFTPGQRLRLHAAETVELRGGEGGPAKLVQSVERRAVVVVSAGESDDSLTVALEGAEVETQPAPRAWSDKVGRAVSAATYRITDKVGSSEVVITSTPPKNAMLDTARMGVLLALTTTGMASNDAKPGAPWVQTAKVIGSDGAPLSMEVKRTTAFVGAGPCPSTETEQCPSLVTELAVTIGGGTQGAASATGTGEGSCYVSLAPDTLAPETIVLRYTEIIAIGEGRGAEKLTQTRTVLATLSPVSR